MLNFFKVLFSSKKPIQSTANDAPVGSFANIGINMEVVNTPHDTPPDPPREIVKLKIQPKPQKPHIKSEKNDIMEVTPKDTIMPEIFLVVIDTNGRTEAKNFQPGIQNFYFVYANDEQNAKQVVLSTFSKRPGMMDQLVNATKATRLQAIVTNMGQGSNFWTYIPFGGQRNPGQQSILPTPEKLLRQDEFGEQSAQAYVPSAPVGGEAVTADDLRGVQFSGADGAIINKLRSGLGTPLNEEAPPLNPEQQVMMGAVQEQNKILADQNKAMMEQMATMMAIVQAQTQAAAPKSKKTKSSVQEVQ